MKSLSKKIIALLVFTSVLITNQSCVKDLKDVVSNDQISANIYKDPANYKAVLAKIYGGLALSGQQGPAGKPDITGIDEGFGQYLRAYWQHQELTTDEAVIAWNDRTVKDFHNHAWTSSDVFIAAMYYRIFYQISSCNEFIRESSDAKLSERGITVPEVKAFRAEARFLRALSYYHALDLFGNVPFVTDLDNVGAFLPKQSNKADLFKYIESELLAIDGDLVAARANEYARADKAAAWMLLAKLYLNAEVYISTPKYTEAATYAKKVLDAGYTLEPSYKNLFLRDNDKSKEIIFPIAFDGKKTQTWGGMTYLVHAPVGGSMKPADFGINGGWGGLRTTKGLVQLFETSDNRALFHTDGQKLEIADIGVFTDGYAVAKYKNVDQAGVKGSDSSGDHVDNDFPMFRLADAILIYAEAVERGGTGDKALALTKVNELRKRAGVAAFTTYTKDDILNERGRELFWEGHRRTDLIRYGKFISGYNWPWKGGVKDGKDIDKKYAIFPIPLADKTANPNLVQNDGY